MHCDNSPTSPRAPVHQRPARARRLPRRPPGYPRPPTAGICSSSPTATSDPDGIAESTASPPSSAYPSKTSIADGGHYSAVKAFGPITYRAFHIPARHRAAHRALMTYADSVTRGNRRPAAGGLMAQDQAPSTHRPRHAGGCAQPVLLRGRTDHLDGSTGELIHRYTTAHEPGGVLPVACKTRRASRCLSCAETYRADTYQLIRAGLAGGKGVPATVAAHPACSSPSPPRRSAPSTPRRESNGRVLACRPRRKRQPARTAGRSPAPNATPQTIPGSANRSARTATTTPARSCSTPAPPNSGAASPSPCAAPSPARPG